MPEYENNSVQLLNHNSIPQERKELLAKLCCDAKQFLFTQLDDKYAPTFWNDLSPEKKRAWIEDIEHWIERNNMPLYSMHQYWVLQMSAEGWSFGPDGKDEENKKHPHIVPWEMLPPYARAGYALSRAIISQLMND